MRPGKPYTSPTWLRAALYFTTRSGAGVAVAPKMPKGWHLRLASPRWFCIWREYRRSLIRLRIILMPQPCSGDIRRVWHILLIQQMNRSGLTQRMPTVEQLAVAETVLLGHLAPAWKTFSKERNVDQA